MSLVRVVNGVIRPRARVVVHSTQRKYTVERSGSSLRALPSDEELRAGEVGFLIAAIREIDAAPVGDTIVDAQIDDCAGATRFQEDSAARVRRPLSVGRGRVRRFSSSAAEALPQ